MLGKYGSVSAASNLHSGFSPRRTLDQRKLRKSCTGFLIAMGSVVGTKNIYRSKFLKAVGYLNLRAWDFTHLVGRFMPSVG